MAQQLNSEVTVLQLRIQELEFRVLELEKLLLVRLFNGDKNTTMPDRFGLIEGRLVNLEKQVGLA